MGSVLTAKEFMAVRDILDGPPSATGAGAVQRVAALTVAAVPMLNLIETMIGLIRDGGEGNALAYLELNTIIAAFPETRIHRGDES